MAGNPITDMLATAATSPTNNVKDTEGNQANQQIGKIVEMTEAQGDDLVTALEAIAAAINAKPSA